MVRVLFLVAPFKRRMIERMIQYFSPQTICEVFTPFTKPTLATSKLRTELLGDMTLDAAVARFKPDIIYSDNALFAAQMEVQELLHRRRVPLITHLRGDWWREYWAWFLQAKWPAHIIGTQHFVYQWFGLLTARRVTPICRWLDNVVKHYIPRKNTQVVYQGVAPQDFFEEEPMVEVCSPSVAIIQNHTIYPKVLGLLNFKHVIEQLPRINFYITEGEHFAPGYLPDVKQAYSKLKNVHFIGAVEGPSGVRKVLSSADCYVLASGLDCCPTTVLEAGLMRRPVLASRVGGVPEIVLQGETGWTIENNAYDEWIERIRLLVEDEALRRRMGGRAREWVSRKFGWPTIANQVEKLLFSEVNDAAKPVFSNT